MSVAHRFLWCCLALVPVFTGCAQQTVHPVHHAGTFLHAAVASDHPVASEAGAEMLRMGGNAVDAAVATSFCLSVVRPYSCGIGGGGFMVIHDPSHSEGSIVLNYRETAPASVGPTHYVKHGNPMASRFGCHAAGVPGTVAGLLNALEHYGTLDRSTVLEPAIRAAEDGFRADSSYVQAVRDLYSTLREQDRFRFAPFDETQAAIPFGPPDIRIGDHVSNRPQARALRLIAQDGPDAFYRGAIADEIVRVMKRSGGPMQARDLARYSVRTRPPLRGQFGEYEILTMPPPSSGGIALIQLFGLLERHLTPVQSSPHRSAASVHLIVEMMKHVFADRAEWLADDAYVDVPIDELFDATYLDQVASRIIPRPTLKPEQYGSRRPPPEDAGTSHFSVIDSNGMAVACTETINLSFGSLVLVPKFGFMLNNEMDDFTTVPDRPNAFGLAQSTRNLPAPGKRPLSSMSPTILVRNGRPEMVAGASGGPRIITATFQALLNAGVFDQSADEAVSAARFHHQWMPDRVELERSLATVAPDIRAELEQRGHAVGERTEIGVVQLIVVRDGVIEAASDPRKGGAPAGY